MSGSSPFVRDDQSRDCLLVEGRNDCHVLWSLFKRHNVAETFDVKDKGGLENLLDTLDVELDASGRTHLGIVVDADIDLTSRWTSVRDRFVSLGYSDMPLTPDAAGTVVPRSGRPTIGVWMMPNNTLPGMLEDFASMLIPPEDKLWPFADEVVVEAMARGSSCPKIHHTKARIHTWLAWQQDPGTPIGQAITKRYLDANATAAQLLVNWVQGLFSA